MGKRLLMIDDDAGIAKVVGLIARVLGMDFQATDTPLIAAEVFADYRPNIVMIDMIMPKKTQAVNASTSDPENVRRVGT